MAKTYYKREEGLNPTNQPRLRIYDSVAEAEAHLDDLNPGDVVGTKLIDEAADIAGAQNLIADALSLLQDKIPDDASAGNQCITRETFNRSLREFIDVLEPIGTVKLCDGTYDTDHWHVCDGTNGTIDLREAVPVGTGERATLTTHDTYDVGEFKEDQVQAQDVAITDPGHSHSYTYPRAFPLEGGPNMYGMVTATGDTSKETTGITAALTGARTGTTTHGRQVGVVFIQKIRNYGDD